MKKYKINPPKIFVINLKRSVDRKRHMEKILSELPIKVEFVEAVDSHKLSDEEIFQVYDDETCKRNIGRSLSKGEIGCFLSHIKAWKLIQKQNLNEAFILEDDIIIKDKTAFLEILKNRNKFPKDWEIVLFAHSYCKNKTETSFLFYYIFKVYKQYKLKRFLVPAEGTLGYLLNQRAIEKLLKESSAKMKGTVDNYYTGNDKIVNVYGIEPVIIEESKNFDTTISNRWTEENRVNPISAIDNQREIYIPTKMDKIIDRIELILNFLKILKIVKFIYHIPKYYLNLKKSLKLKKYKNSEKKEKI